jgi:RNA-directed DNA polymerase
LSITIDELEFVLNLPPGQKYVSKPIPKKDGTSRTVYNPDYRLRKIQRRINTRILADPNVVIWPDHIFGSIPNQVDEHHNKSPRDYVACARTHCNSKSILTMDIMNFFENIHQFRVESIFFDFFKYSTEVSRTLAEICCFEGRVIQGALTSSYIASLCMYEGEGKIVERLARKGLRYTRLVDDITISTTISNYNFDYAQANVEKMLVDMELPINRSKTRIQYCSTTPLTVHGLRVAYKEPRLPSDEVRRIRAAVQNIEKLSQEGQYRTSHSYRHDFNRCMGRVNKLSRVQHKQHRPLVSRLKKIFPLPSKNDIDRAKKIVNKLEADHGAKRDSFWYSKRFYLAHERLNVLKRTYPAISQELRIRLRRLRPSYE